MGTKGEFGKGDGFPWGKLFKPDMDHFKEFTENCVIFCGRETFETLPCKFRGLFFVVFSNSAEDLSDIKCKNGTSPDCIVSKEIIHDVSVVHGVEDSIAGYIEFASKGYKTIKGWDTCVIGGASIICNTLHIMDCISYTKVSEYMAPDGYMNCDTSIDKGVVNLLGAIERRYPDSYTVNKFAWGDDEKTHLLNIRVLDFGELKN